MRNILVIGAGKSSSCLIKYLLDNSAKEQWIVTVADVSEEIVLQKTNNHPNSKAIKIDLNDEEFRNKIIAEHDIVISMLPASMHYQIAEDCLRHSKNLVTASYVSPSIAALDKEVQKKGLLFLNECGLDPGIDHMSAMQFIDDVKAKGHKVISFKSYCGGLVAPESNDNPWGYKFSWNPRNVILAGNATAQYLHQYEIRYIPYNRIFKQIEKIHVEGYGYFDAYANRDSLSYIAPYRLDGISTMLRGTLRSDNYCKAWNLLVQLGLTDDSWKINNCRNTSYGELVRSFLPASDKNTKEGFKAFFNLEDKDVEYKMIEWLEILSDKKINTDNGSPAQLLQLLLEEKWKLRESDKDMIVMQHQFITSDNKSTVETHASLVVKGEDNVYTAMAKTVGLPVAIAVKLILNRKIKSKGVVIPVNREIYEPVLNELKEYGVLFSEKVI